MLKPLLLEAMPELPPSQLARFEQYYALLIEYNKSVNLTAITEPEEVAQKHFLDSLLPLSLGLIPRNAACMDVGTGAGFPGIPLLILRPDLSMILLDALHKRVVFLRRAIQELELLADAVHARAEDAARDKRFRGQMDVALSRAVAPLSVIAELTLPFLKTGGVSLAYKGPGVDEELPAASRALKLLHAEAVVHAVCAPWGERRIVALTKRGETPAAYPRRAGIPAKQPL